MIATLLQRFARSFYRAARSLYTSATSLKRVANGVYMPARAIFGVMAVPLAPVRAELVSLQAPSAAMSQLIARFWFSLRFAWLAATVLLVLGLNQRAVSVLRLPQGTGQTRLAAPPKATVVKQKVQFEATGTVKHFVVPLADAWLPLPTLGTAWLPALRRALVVPRLLAGIRAGEVFRARLLAVALSPQAP